jgi:hypothetical protein
MAAGAIPPPLFFERRRVVGEHIGSGNGSLKEIRTPQVLITRLSGRRASMPDQQRPGSAEGY